MNSKEIKHIISTGKLKSHVVTGGFLDIYWKTPDLEEFTYWLFKFTSIDNKLISVKKITPSGIYRKYKAKRYVPMIETLMNDLLNSH